LPPDKKIGSVFDEDHPYSLAKIIASIIRHTHGRSRNDKQIGTFYERNNLIFEANKLMNQISEFESAGIGILERSQLVPSMVAMEGGAT